MTKLFIEKSIEIYAPAGNVWKTLTDPNISREWIRSWWYEFDVLESDWRPGSPVLWKLCNGDLGAEGIVIKSEPYWELAFTVNMNDRNLGQKEMLAFKLREIEDVTLLAVSIGDFSSSAAHEALYPAAVDNWDKSLSKIKSLTESTVKAVRF